MHAHCPGPDPISIRRRIFLFLRWLVRFLLRCMSILLLFIGAVLTVIGGFALGGILLMLPFRLIFGAMFGDPPFPPGGMSMEEYRALQESGEFLRREIFQYLFVLGSFLTGLLLGNHPRIYYWFQRKLGKAKPTAAPSSGWHFRKRKKNPPPVPTWADFRAMCILVFSVFAGILAWGYFADKFPPGTLIFSIFVFCGIGMVFLGWMALHIHHKRKRTATLEAKKDEQNGHKKCTICQ